MKLRLDEQRRYTTRAAASELRGCGIPAVWTSGTASSPHDMGAQPRRLENH